MEIFGPPEQVYVERDRYDGPRSGIADIGGMPHRFQSLFDEAENQYLGTFMVWPIAPSVLDLEIKQWRIFVEWNNRFESGEADTESHPGQGGLNARWDELEALLKPDRAMIPSDARQARAELHPIDREARYAASGPDYQLAWAVAG